MSTENDEEKRKAMFWEIRILEGNNLKTHKFSDREMVNKIIKIIKTYADEDSSNGDDKI